MKKNRLILLGLAGFAALAAAAAVIFQDALARWRMRPSTPFQVATPPPAPQYGARGAWLLWPDGLRADAGADVFYIHSTAYYSPDGWNSPIGAPSVDQSLKSVAAPNEVGPFVGLGPVYAPRYRQATLFAFFTHKFDGLAARRLAYRDVARAFERYLADSDGERPLVLVGYGQGALHALGLLQDYFQSNESLRNRLAAAYVIGQATPLDLFEEALSATPPCSGPDDFRCVISYVDLEERFGDEMRRARDRSMTWTADGDLVATRGRELLCINPLTWKADETYAPPERHLGAVSATGLRLGEPPPPVPRAVGAQCTDGILVVDRPRQGFLQRGGWFGAKWRTPDFNLFYTDLAADARRRVEATAAKMEEEYRFLQPIEETVDIVESPINKVPNP